MEQYKWEEIYSMFEKTCVEKHISLLKNTRTKNVIVPCFNGKYIDVFDFVPNTLCPKNKKEIISNPSKIKYYLYSNPNIVKWIIVLSSIGYRGSIHAALCMYASICDFEYRGISCDFSLEELKKEIKNYLASVNVKLSFSTKYPVFEEYILSDELLDSISSISLPRFIELSVLNLDYITRNNKIVHYITTGSEEIELIGTHKEQILKVVKYWSSRMDETVLSVDFKEAHERCWACGLKRKLQLCHIIPASLGGEKVPSNLVLMCKHCHRLAPNVDNPDAMWDYLKGHKVTLYDTYWMEEAKKEFRLMYNQDFDKELKNVTEYAERNNISIESYFSKDYMKGLPKISNHFGERINASTWAFLEYALLYRVKRDLNLLPKYKFSATVESFSNNMHFISVPKNIYEDYGNRTLNVQVKIGDASFITKLDVSPYPLLYIPNNIVEELTLIVGKNAEVSIVEYMDSQDIEIPRELEELLTPISMRYFMFLSYTDKMKFINYIVAESDATKRVERVRYCASLLESYKKFQDR